MSGGRARGVRKAVVGTTLFSVFGAERPYHGLDHRLGEMRARLREMDAQAREQHGRGLDIAVFPENSLNARTGSTLAERSVLFDDALRERLGALAREVESWLVVCFNLREDSGDVFNASVLLDRDGRVHGIYRKVFCLADPGGQSVEGGKRPGTDFPVFETDFGRVAMMICFDMGFEEIVAAYKAAGADLVLWSTMSPQTLLPRLYARRFGFHVVSATPRDNASIIDPLGEIIAQTRTEGAAIAEIALDWRIVHWQPALRDGQALFERFGDSVGGRYNASEDFGIFWSNDPKRSIDHMLAEAGILTDDALRALAIQARASALKKAG